MLQSRLAASTNPEFSPPERLSRINPKKSPCRKKERIEKEVPVARKFAWSFQKIGLWLPLTWQQCGHRSPSQVRMCTTPPVVRRDGLPEKGLDCTREIPTERGVAPALASSTIRSKGS